MANFSALKTAIQNAIKQNGNEEITGDVLQQILLSVVNTMGDGAINTIEQNLSNETLARQNGDNTLQSNINAEALARGNADTQLQNAINAIKADIDNGHVYAGIATPSSTPVSGKVFYVATAAGTYTNFGGQVLTQGINILRYNGSAWSSQQLIGIDDAPTAGSNSLVKSGGVQNELALGAVYDVSAKNPTGGHNSDGKWESLSALLSDANLNTLIPTAYRKGGMSIKFIQSSDNNYVQYRCMAQNFTTDVTQWQGVDEVPTAGSKNFTESGGTYNSILQESKNNAVQLLNTSQASTGSYVYISNIKTIPGKKYRIIYSSSASRTRNVQIRNNGNVIKALGLLVFSETEKYLDFEIENTGNQIVIADESAAGTVTFNIKLLDMDSGITIKEMLKREILSEAYLVNSVARDSNGDVSAAGITFSDGTTGTMNITRDNDGNVISVVGKYNMTNYTLTITRDANGNVTATSIS